MQTNPGEANQVNLARGDTNVRETAAEPERSELQRPRVNSEERGVDQPSNNDTVEHMEVDVAPVRSNGVALSATSDRNPSVDDAAMAAEPGHEVKMDTAKDEENAKVPSSAEEGHAAPPPSLPSVSAPDSAPAPVGLGLGALQPLPARVSVFLPDFDCLGLFVIIYNKVGHDVYCPDKICELSTGP